MPDVVNDCLGLTQYLTQQLGREATDHLLTFVSLSIEQWKEAKSLLPQAIGTPNRSTKEATIRDCVEIFVDSKPEDEYLIRNLGLLPGLQPESLALIDHTVKTLYAVKQATASVLKVIEARHADTHRDLPINVTPAATPPSRIFQEGDSPDEQPEFPPISSVADTVRNSTAQKVPQGYSTAVRQQPINNPIHSRQNKANKWTFGTNTSTQDKQIPQLKNVCLAIKSGPEETVASLSTLIKKWSQLRSIEVEAYSMSPHNTVFRVKFVTPANLFEKWCQPTTWPSRISVKMWKGNPNTKLKDLASRIYRKKIYIGQVNVETPLQQIEANIQEIYKEEMSSQKIAQVEVFLNQASWNRQERIQAQNINHTFMKSVCVVLTSHPGQSLNDVGLKIGHYPPRMQRSIRVWNGPIPLQEGQEANSSALNQKW